MEFDSPLDIYCTQREFIRSCHKAMITNTSIKYSIKDRLEYYYIRIDMWYKFYFTKHYTDEFNKL